MKTIKIRIMMIIAVAAIMVPAVSLAQARISNSSRQTITIQSLSGGDEAIANPGKTALVRFAPSTGEFKFKLFRRDGQRDVLVGTITKTVTDGRCALSADEVAGKKPVVSSSQAFNGDSAFQTVDDTPIAGNAPTTNLVLTNKTSNRIEVITGMFRGVSLMPGQSTTAIYKVPTGRFEFTCLIPAQPDSSDSGLEYYHGVFSTIVCQDQTELDVKNENIRRTGGEAKKLRMRSHIPFSFAFTAGPWKGEALSQGNMTGRKELNEGFNSIGIQFLEKGIKYQATLEILVTKYAKVIDLRLSNVYNVKSISAGTR